MVRTDPSVGARQDGNEPLTLCPACGYDLRGTGGDRCSECGLAIDRAALRQSGFPWAHRRQIGRVRAYVATVWRVVSDGHTLAETARPQEARDGRAFRRATAALMAAALLGAWAWVVVPQEGLAFLAYKPTPAAGSAIRSNVPWVADLAVPWSAGATMPWVVPLGLVLLAAYLTGVQQSVFRTGAFPAEYRRRAGAIAHYAAAPLALLLPALGCFLLAPVASRWLGIRPLAVAFAAAGALLTLAAWGGTLLRVGQWVRRVRHGGAGAVVLAASELLGLWLWGAVLLLVLLPWCVGFFWIVIDSFR